MNKLFTLKNRAQKTAALVVVFVIAFVFSSNAQQATFQERAEPAKETIKIEQTTGKRFFENGFIKVELTGDQQADNEKIAAAKENLAKENPELYRKMMVSVTQESASDIELKNLPAANPELNKSITVLNQKNSDSPKPNTVLPASTTK
jgi:hypothetical protein